MIGAGYQRRTTDGVIGTSGKPILVYAVHLVSGGSPSTLDVHDGTSTTGPKVLSIVGLANKAVTMDFGDEGLLFGSGCYLNVDANISFATVIYEQVLS